MPFGIGSVTRRRAGRRLFWLCAALVALGGGLACERAAHETPPPAADATRLQIDDGVAPDSSVAALIAPYRTEIEARMSEPLAICPVPMRTGKPEGQLGALIADLVLAEARRASDMALDACILNNGGLRIPWPSGVITLGHVYEVMPFDNTLDLLRFSAAQVETLAAQLAAHYGEPVSGMRFRIVGPDRAVADLTVAGAPLADRDYWIATNSYLAGGGGHMPVLWEPRERRAMPLLIRDAIAAAVRRHGRPGARAGEELGALPVPEMGRIRAEEEAR